MGRRTYESFAPVWPTRSGDEYSDLIDTTPLETGVVILTYGRPRAVTKS